ncbi:MAG: hypothetical protein AAB922_04795 [Patescibacteria group bacterium]
MSSYPTTKELVAIGKYDIQQGFNGLLELIEPHFADYGYCHYSMGRLTVTTGGWSGCEDVMGTLQNNTLFWSMCWEASFKGGMYKFRIPKDFGK